MSTRFEYGKMNSEFVCEEYLAAKVVLSDNPEDCRHVAIEHSDTDMLELGLDRETGLLKKIVLVLCNHFSFVEGGIEAPEAPERIPLFDLPRECSCDLFSATVYEDGLHVKLAEKDSACFIACGNLVMGFDDGTSLVDLYVKGLAPREAAHIRRELELESESS